MTFDKEKPRKETLLDTVALAATDWLWHWSSKMLRCLDLELDRWAEVLPRKSHHVPPLRLCHSRDQVDLRLCRWADLNQYCEAIGEMQVEDE